MKQEQWLMNYIDATFANVRLGEGIDIYAAQSLDDYGNPDEDHLSLTAERLEWRRVPFAHLFPRYGAVTFLDAEGFRFYTPVIMKAMLALPEESDEPLSAWFFSNFKITKTGLIKGIHFNNLYSSRQRASIIRFLKYLVYNCGGPTDCDAFRRLNEIQTRTSP